MTEVQGQESEPRVVRRTHRDTRNFFFFLNVSDAYMYSELHPVDYRHVFGSGTGTWRVDYALPPPAINSALKLGKQIRESGKPSLSVCLMLFANQTSGADIRLNAKWDGGEDDSGCHTLK